MKEVSNKDKETEGALKPASQLTNSASMNRNRLANDFAELSLVSFGGFGGVYLARHRLDRRHYAVKEVPLVRGLFADTASMEEGARKALTEVYLLSRLERPFVVRYHCCWIEHSTPQVAQSLSTGSSVSSLSGTERSLQVAAAPKRDGEQFSLFIMMEYCAGGTLKDLLVRPLRSRFRKLQLLVRVAAALEGLHASSVAHRDVKPANIFFSEKGELKLGDFGLWNLSSLSLHPFLLREGFVDLHGQKGSFPYRESVVSVSGTDSNDSASLLHEGFRADCYALGVICLEVLVGFVTDMEKVLFFKELRQNDSLSKVRENLREEDAELVEGLMHEHNRKTANWARKRLEHLLDTADYE